ncbi:MAG: hypothetical protein A3H42_06295 [Deltaproteobacteria bacterium RIFCSPLOWO2_02_FULL_46_8]|nr:MAG: hypothetical protein A3H42_06295 [Deltaproteobacteria bacterium RIFCSPLOWO2_02_FULL_46_8]
MSRFAVIASNSFSGGHMVERLLQDDSHEVVGVSRSPEKSPLFLPYKKRENPRFQFWQFDLNNQSSQILECLDDFQPEYIINFAAQGEVGTSWKYPQQWFETNAVGIVKLANALKERNYLKRYVQISTPEVYGSCTGQVTETTPINPSSPYAASKAAGDLFLATIAKQYQFPCVFIRSTNVYGVHQQLYRIIPRTIIYLRQGKTIPLHGGGKAIKSYIHIKDVCDGVFAGTLNGQNSEIYHLSAYEEIAVCDLVRKICEKMGYDFSEVTENVAERPGQDARYFIDSTKARTAFGWEPKIKMDEGVQEMIEWIDENWSAIQNESLEYIHQQ